MKSKDQLKRKLKRNQKKTDLIPLPKTPTPGLAQYHLE